jgi:threonine synthase
VSVLGPPLEAFYDYSLVRQQLTRAAVESRPRNLWRYRELLPITASHEPGSTPLHAAGLRAKRLAAALGIDELYIKDDSVNPSDLSTRTVLVSIAATRAIELGFEVFGLRVSDRQPRQQRCRPTPHGWVSECFVLHSERSRGRKSFSARRSSTRTFVGVRGNYDEWNRLCTQIADRLGWGFANINLRAYYAEGCEDNWGSKSPSSSGGVFLTIVVSPSRRHAAAADCPRPSAS